MFSVLKTLEIKYKLLLVIILLIIVIPFIIWLVTLINDGVIHFFGGKTKDDIIASQKTTISKLVDTKVNNEKTLTIVRKKNNIDIKHITKVNEKIKKASQTTNNIKSNIDDNLDKYVNDAALMLKDMSLLKVNIKQPTVKEVTTIKKQEIKKTNVIKKIESKSYVVDKKKYEIEGYKNIANIWIAYKNIKDVE